MVEMKVELDTEPLQALLADLVEVNKQLAVTLAAIENGINSRINIGLEESDERLIKENK